MKVSRLKAPRLTVWLVASIVLAILAYVTRQSDPLLSVTFYKAHLMSLGGWGGYWLDRLIFPYARPHEFVPTTDPVEVDMAGAELTEWECEIALDPRVHAELFKAASLRRAIIVAASLICVGLAA
ncbi:putative holin [Burkholderia multivorans]|uniref:putative holin n=1 Tax=Burkholderia multivorans TaxID=87883 RepID=UPI001C22C45E|nr:putative holin [Burkholderia multivorans]MBU9314808.1 putative holin [Burkholderia multivorans]MDN7938737.1 putative holin [Burkholderia multivorans]